MSRKAVSKKKKDSFAEVGPFRLTPSGMEVVGESTFEQWESAVRVAKTLAVSMMWIVGDLLVYGEQQFGERYSQALEAADYADDTLKIAKWVASKFPADRRHDRLPFSHHQEVAALPAAKAEALLDESEKDGLSKMELRERVAEEREKSFEPTVSRLTNENNEEPADEGAEFVAAAESLCRDMDIVAGRVHALKASRFGYSIHVDSAVEQVKAARATIWQGRPSRECPYCDGEPEGCTVCKGTGRVKETTYKAGKEAKE